MIRLGRMTSSLSRCVITFLIVQLARSFNIEYREKVVNRFHFSLSDGQPPNYAGYRFTGTRTPNYVRVTSGAPKSNETTGEAENGAVIQCMAEVQKSSGSADWLSNVTCHVALDDASLSLGRLQTKENDFFGTTLLSRNSSETDEFTVCAPGRQKRCGVSGTFVPGACYSGQLRENITFLKGWGEVPCFETFLDVIFLIDSSTSISDSDFNLQKEILTNVTELFRDSIGVSTQVGFLQYYHNLRPGFVNGQFVFISDLRYERPASLGSCDSVECLQDAIEMNMTHLKSPDTYTATAIAEAVEDFKNSSNANVAKKILILITDGETSSGDQMNLRPSYRLTESNNIIVYAIGVGSNINLNHLRISANGGTSDDRVFRANNYIELSEQLRNLTREITEVAAEDSGAGEGSLENAQIGISGHVVEQTGELVLGAVGAYFWSGTLIKYNSLDQSIVQVLNISSVRGFFESNSENSYLGYAITSGNFDGGNEIFIAASAPRYKFSGAVIVINSTLMSNENFFVITPYKSISDDALSQLQLGSYFGASLLGADINGDGQDDLLVGAPLFTEKSYDEGRVFVYITEPSYKSSLARWVNSSFIPSALVGENTSGGRFGTSIASAGDLNDDGYMDVVIGAPDTNQGRGAVFVYYGGPNGIDSAGFQKISASQFEGNSLFSFGEFLQGGLDVDGNLYPDLFVGAPGNDTVMLFRTRPIVRINSSLIFEPDATAALPCVSQAIRNCFKLKACIAVSGKSIGEIIEIEYKIILDQALMRIEFREEANNSNSAFHSTNGTALLNASNSWCTQYQIYVKNNVIDDYIAPIRAKMTYNLSENHLMKPLSAVQQRNAKNEVFAEVRFLRGSANNSHSNYDLSLEGDVTLPSYYITLNNGSKIDLSNGRGILVLPAQNMNQTIRIRLNLSNFGEDAYGSKVLVSYPSALAWNQVLNVTRSNPNDSPCIYEGDEVDQGLVKTRTLFYSYDQYFSNIFPTNQWCSFDLALNYNDLRFNGGIDNFQLDFRADISNKQYDSDNQTTNNNVSYVIPVLYKSVVAINSEGLYNNRITFNYTNASREINSFADIGNFSGPADIRLEIENSGKTRIPNTSISFVYPGFLTSIQPLLYLFELSCTSRQARASCVCNDEMVNIYNISRNQQQGSNITVSPGKQLTQTAFNCNFTNPASYCRQVTCYITNFNPSDVVEFSAQFYLWTNTFNYNDEIREASFTLELLYSSADSPAVVNMFGLPIAQYFQPIVYAIKFRDVDVDLTLLYIILPSVIIIIIFLLSILYKCGYFESKYKKKQQEYAWQEPESNTYNVSGENSQTPLEMQKDKQTQELTQSKNDYNELPPVDVS